MTKGEPRDNLAYLRQMLGELRIMAKDEGADMLSYLIEMAYVEAGDLQAGRLEIRTKSSAPMYEPHGRG